MRAWALILAIAVGGSDAMAQNAKRIKIGAGTNITVSDAPDSITVASTSGGSPDSTVFVTKTNLDSVKANRALTSHTHNYQAPISNLADTSKYIEYADTTAKIAMQWELDGKQAMLGFTPVNTTLTLTAGYGIAGGGDLSSNRTFTLDTTKYATSAISGVMKFSDWGSFNAKQSAIANLSDTSKYLEPGEASNFKWNKSGSSQIGDSVRFIEGANITLTQSGNTLTIAGPAGSGEANTASNLGGGLANFDTKSGVDLRFNSFATADFDLGTNLITIDGTKWATLASPTFTGTVTVPTPFTLGAVSVTPTGTELNFVDGVTSAIQTQLDGKQATLVSATNIKTINGSSVLGAGDLVISSSVTATSGIGNPPNANGTQTITHNLGRTPVVIRIYAIGNKPSGSSATNETPSFGLWSASGQTCIYRAQGASAGQASSTAFAIRASSGATAFCTGVIGNVGATSFDIVWTESGTSDTTPVYLWEAQ